MKKLLMILTALLMFTFSCGTKNNPVGVHEHDISDLPEHEHTTPPLAPVGDAISQLLNMNQPDPLFNQIFTANDSGLVSFQTSQEFRFKGAPNTFISVVRTVEISHQTLEGTDIQIFGTAIGIIQNSVGDEVTILNPGQTYYYLVTWPDTDPFPFELEDGRVAFWTNFYTLVDDAGSSVSKRGSGQLPFSQGSYRKF